MTCRCKSYNRPDLGGDRPEVILPKPSWSERESGICVDACIANAIRMLWANGIETRGCCCGHNRDVPNVVIEENQDAAKTKHLLELNDGRSWKVFQWRLVET